MNLDKYNSDIGIAVGVLSALSVLYAVSQTWSWSKRASKLGIDFVTLIKLFFYSCGAVANAFFVVMLGSCIWWLVFYKVGIMTL